MINPLFVSYEVSIQFKGGYGCSTSVDSNLVEYEIQKWEDDPEIVSFEITEHTERVVYKSKK